MKTSGLTEKRMSNKRFRKTEQAIFIAYYTLKDYPTARKLAKRAHISRATLYRHHTNPTKIPRNYEEYLLATYSRIIHRLINKDQATLKVLFLRTLIFISINDKVFGFLFLDGHQDIIKKMFRKLKKRVLQEWNMAGNLEKLYIVYENEVVGVIEAWHQKDFSKKYLAATLDDILFLTKTSPHRLSRLIDNN